MSPAPLSLGQVAPPAAIQVQDEIVVPSGAESFTITEEALLGPALETTTVKVVESPGT